MGWSEKYKKSINCSNPKGFSQKAHCKGRKKRNEMKLKLSDLKEVIRKVVEAKGPSRSFNKLATAYQKEALKHQSMVKDQKRLAAAFVAEKDPKKKERAKKAIIDHHHKVKAQEKKMKDAENQMMKGLGNEKIDLDESVNENRFLDALKDFFRKEEPTFKQMAKRYKKKADFIKWFVKSQAKMGVVFKNDGYGAYMMNRMGKLWDRVHGQPEDKKYVGESINEGPSTEEKRIAMLAVRKQAKYRSVSLEQAIQDQINALEELKRDAKRGKLK